MKHSRSKNPSLPALTWTAAAAGIPRATLDGRTRALIEDHTGIIEFSTDRLRLSSKLGEIVVIGSDLSLSQVCGRCLTVCGRIDGVHMPEGGSCND